MGKVIKFPKLLAKTAKAHKSLTTLLVSSYKKAYTTASNAISFDRKLKGLKTIKNTYAATKANFLNRTGQILDRKTFLEGLKARIGQDQAAITKSGLDQLKIGQLRKAVLNRRQAGKTSYKALTTVDRVIGKRSTIDRVVNARGQGIRFIKKNGRIIPIRIKK